MKPRRSVKPSWTGGNDTDHWPSVAEDAATAALARALVRTGMYVDAGIDTSARLDNPRKYAAALLNDPELALDGLHWVMIRTTG